MLRGPARASSAGGGGELVMALSGVEVVAIGRVNLRRNRIERTNANANQIDLSEAARSVTYFMRVCWLPPMRAALQLLHVCMAIDRIIICSS